MPARHDRTLGRGPRPRPVGANCAVHNWGVALIIGTIQIAVAQVINDIQPDTVPPRPPPTIITPNPCY